MLQGLGACILLFLFAFPNSPLLADNKSEKPKPKNTSQTESELWDEPTQPRGDSCFEKCLQDGEHPYDCEYFCVQTVQNTKATRFASN